MLDRVTGMQVFQRVAALGSLSAAARVLGMSQTMATKHMAALEDRLGVRLMHRTTRKTTLTEAGRRYLDAVERILSEIEHAEADASRDSVQVRGTLRFNAPVSFGIREIAPLLGDLARRHPQLTVELGLNDRQVDLVEEGWDLVVRIGNLAESSMIVRRLADCRMVVCAAPGYLEKHAAPRTIADLVNHNCLGYTLSPLAGVDFWSFGTGGKARVRVSGNLKANNGDTLVAAAVAGQGLVYQPQFLVADAIAAGQLVPLTFDYPAIELDGIYAAYPSARQPPAKVRAVIDFLADRWQRHPPGTRLSQGNPADD